MASISFVDMLKSSYRYLLFLLLGLVSCTSSNNQHSTKTSFRYNEFVGISSLDPAFAKDQSLIWPCLQLYNGLVRFDEYLKIQPCIAKTWEVSNDGLTYIFHLRSDVFFHRNNLFAGKDNSRAVTANDFVYSLNRLTSKTVASPGSWVLNSIDKDDSGNLKGVQAIDDSTFQISLSNPNPSFLGLLTMPYCSVVPKEVVEYYGNDFRSHPCGTGPFKFSFWKEGVRLILLKNENYFQTDSNGQHLPYLDAVEVSFISDKQSAFIEFLKGNLDFMSGLDASYKDELLTRSGNLQAKYKNKFVMETEPYLNTEYLGFMMEPNSDQSKMLNDIHIRKALSYSIDRKKMIAYLRNNMGIAGNYGFVPPGMPSFDTTVIGYPYNIQKAQEELKLSGHEEGRGLSEITLSTTGNYLDLCEFIKNQWEEIGFKIKIDVNQAAVHRKMIAEKKLAFFRGSWLADYPDAENYLSLFYSKNFSPGGPNNTHYSNKDFDELFDRSMKETVDSIRFTMYRELDQMVMDQAPVIILYYDKILRLHQNNIHDLKSNAMNLLMLEAVKKQ